MLTAGVAVDKATLNFDKEFSYIVPKEFEETIAVGSIVLVPFGKGSNLRMGIVLKLEQRDDVSKLKQIIDVKTQQYTVSEFAVKLIHYLKETTFCTYFEGAKTVIPFENQYKIQNGKLCEKYKVSLEKLYTSSNCENIEKLTEKQKKVYQYLKGLHKSIKEICEYCNVTKSVVDSLVQKGAVTAVLQEKQYFDNENYKKLEEIILQPQQQKAFDEIVSCTDNKPHLIYGVTSSGKSSVFIKLIQNTLNSGKNAMLLVPEISLTPQIINLVKGHFGDIAGVIHSKLTDKERMYHSRRIQQGLTKVVVGTRSAVFAPMDNLGIIIIDEEHEKTFKSENSPRYSAIRVADFISKEKDAKLVLASATPSVESYFLAQNGYYHLHIMDKRYNDMPMPYVEVVDMHMQKLIGDNGVVCAPVIKYISDNIKDEKQSIILINRRGYSTIAVCRECQHTLQCSDCSVNLVKHKNENKLSCHYCGKSYPVIEKCPVCGGEIQYMGYGTQKVEEYLKQCIPSAKILRMDADTTSKSDSYKQMLEDFSQKKYDILIGTQMVAKGLDFKDVNLVCVLGIDNSLNRTSYNSNEYAFSLLTQVIGRAGRWNKGALAVVQTYDSTNNIIALAQKSDYEGFFNNEIAFRKLNAYPPFCTMCQIAFTNEKEVQCVKDAAQFLQILKECAVKNPKIPLVVLGPAPFNVNLVSGIYRYKITVKCKNTPAFRQFLRQVIDGYLKDKNNKSGIYVNMNPIQE